MPRSVLDAPVSRPLLSREIPRATPAKADLSLQEKRAILGAILRRACEIARLERKQAAAALELDEAQLGRWFTGVENAQVWRFVKHPKLSKALLLAQAEHEERRDGATAPEPSPRAVEVLTEIRVRRTLF
jgi:hypothetical protein